MKSIHLIGAFCVSVLFFTSSCKKDTASGVTCGSGLLCANVDGVNYTATPYNSSTGFFGNRTYNGSYAELIPSSTSTGGYYMVVSGNNGDANSGATYQIDFTITQFPTNGATYTTQAGSASFNYYAGSSSHQNHYLTDATHAGSVTITSIDTITNQVSGTFSYTAVEAPGQNYTPTEHNITSGSFTRVLIRR